MRTRTFLILQGIVIVLNCVTIFFIYDTHRMRMELMSSKTWAANQIALQDARAGHDGTDAKGYTDTAPTASSSVA